MKNGKNENEQKEGKSMQPNRAEPNRAGHTGLSTVQPSILNSQDGDKAISASPPSSSLISIRPGTVGGCPCIRQQAARPPAQPGVVPWGPIHSAWGKPCPGATHAHSILV